MDDNSGREEVTSKQRQIGWECSSAMTWRFARADGRSRRLAKERVSDGDQTMPSVILLLVPASRRTSDGHLTSHK